MRVVKRSVIKPAFTLIEMLVVVSIIAILIAILLPGLRMARDTAMAVQCMSNQRQIGVGALAYAADNRQFVQVSIESAKVIFDQRGRPYRPDWRFHTARYMNGPGTLADVLDSQELYNTAFASVFDCPKGEFPLSRAVEGGVEAGETSKNRGTLGIVMQPSFSNPTSTGTSWPNDNSWHFTDNDVWSTQPGRDWADPTHSVYVADAYRAISTPGPQYPSVEEAGTNHLWPPHHTSKYTLDTQTRRFAARHSDGTNAVFLDGRVERFDTQALDAMPNQDPDNVWDVF